jgi:dephospho-CoA kinase
MALVIGVTGSIAAGKSLVCKMLRDMGAEHCDADTFVHRLYDPGTPGFERVVAIFGEDVVGENGYVDRKKLGAKVFGNAEAMRQLTTAMGPIVPALKTEIARLRSVLPEDGTAVMEAVNLIEADIAADCDATWLVVCSNEVALPRLMARNNFSEAEAQQRIASARDWRLRAPAADLIIRNDGTPEELEQTVRYAYRRAWELHRAAQTTRAYHTWRARNPMRVSA